MSPPVASQIRQRFGTRRPVALLRYDSTCLSTQSRQAEQVNTVTPDAASLRPAGPCRDAQQVYRLSRPVTPTKEVENGWAGFSNCANATLGNTLDFWYIFLYIYIYKERHLTCGKGGATLARVTLFKFYNHLLMQRGCWRSATGAHKAEWSAIPWSRS